MNAETILKSRRYIIIHSRPLDIARWLYHFENGSKEEVLKHLKTYQNPDGGFGHALEPDAWNPASSPIQTWAALEILEEIDFNNYDHPLIKSILRYLQSGSDFDGQCWLNTISSNNDHPHAPWWHHTAPQNPIQNYNPSAYLAGFILKAARQDSQVYLIGKKVAQEAITIFNQTFKSMEMHMVACFAHLLDDIEKAKINDLHGVQIMELNLITRIEELIKQDLDHWDNAYVCKPSRFIKNKNSRYFLVLQNIVQKECDFIRKTQNEDGSWPVTWAWSDYPQQWAISKNWWTSDIIIKNMLFLKHFSDLANN